VFIDGIAEDDTSIPTDVKVPVLQEFYQHIHDRTWHISCRHLSSVYAGPRALKKMGPVALCFIFKSDADLQGFCWPLQVEQITTDC
jgi:hypothetical protein